MEGCPDPQFAGINFHTVKVHQDRLDAVSTGLVQPAAARRRALLSAEGSLHLALDVHFKSVQLVKSPGYQNTDGSGRRQAALYREILLQDCDFHPANGVVVIDIRRDPCHIRIEPAGTRNGQELFAIHLAFPVFIRSEIKRRAHNEPVRFFRNGIDPLFRSGNESGSGGNG